MLNVAIQLMAQGWGLSCWASTWNPTSATRRAEPATSSPAAAAPCPPASSGRAATRSPTRCRRGVGQTGVSYLICCGQIWSVDRADEG